jgi:ubiquinone biosynthesis protein
MPKEAMAAAPPDPGVDRDEHPVASGRPSDSGYRATRVTHMRRYSEIVGVLVRYGFVDVVQALHLTRYRALGRRLLSPFGRSREGDDSRARRFRLALEALGPTFIKFGQALSLRADLMAPEVTGELALLQDAAPPLAPGRAERSIEEAFGLPLAELFSSFEPDPIAAASIAQVHKARLISGELVAVKVRRPGIQTVIEADLAILADLARLAERRIPDAALYSLTGLVEEFSRTIRREQDLSREGRILERVAAQFADDDTVRIPGVYWPLTRPSVLTLEFLDGVPLSAAARGQAGRFDGALLARRGADLVLKQIFVHGLFHADPHPGNILVLPGDVLALVDFGIVGRVSSRLREELAEIILAVRSHDAERLAVVVLEVATPLQAVDGRELERDLDEMLDLYGDVPVGELSMADVFRSVTEAMSRHRLKLPADLLLLIKAVSTIEGVGRQLDPAFKMVAHAAPLVAEVLEENYRPGALARRSADAGLEMLEALRTIPANVAALTRKARSDGLSVQFVHRNLDRFIREMDRSSNRMSFAIVIGAIVIGSSVMVHATGGPQAFGYPLLGVTGFLTAAVLGIGLAIGILRSGRL